MGHYALVVCFLIRFAHACAGISLPLWYFSFLPRVVAWINSAY